MLCSFPSRLTGKPPGTSSSWHEPELKVLCAIAVWKCCSFSWWLDAANNIFNCWSAKGLQCQGSSLLSSIIKMLVRSGNKAFAQTGIIRGRHMACLVVGQTVRLNASGELVLFTFISSTLDPMWICPSGPRCLPLVNKSHFLSWPTHKTSSVGRLLPPSFNLKCCAVYLIRNIANTSVTTAYNYKPDDIPENSASFNTNSEECCIGNSESTCLCKTSHAVAPWPALICLRLIYDVSCRQ